MNKMALLWTCLCCTSAAIVLYWNASQLIGAPPKGRMKDLEFVPSAEVLKMLSMGNTNTVAKLRWIDGFSYLQLQFDKKDDTLIGDAGDSGFERLYDALIELDPKYEPFYQFAIMSESVLKRRNSGLALRSVQRGLLELPHSGNLWQNLAALIKSTENANLASLDGILSRWAEMATSENERYHVERWKSRLGIFELKGLAQLEYWCQLLISNPKRSPLAEMAESTLQQQLNNYAIACLQEVRQANGTSGQLSPVTDGSELLKVYGNDNQLVFNNAALVWGPWVFPMEVAAEMERSVANRSGKITIPVMSLELRSDPYGFPYYEQGGELVSQGKLRFDYEQVITGINNTLPEQAKKRGRWPMNIGEAWEWLGGQRLPPFMAQLYWENNQMRVEWATQPPAQPWDLRAMATYWLQLLNGDTSVK